MEQNLHTHSPDQTKEIAQNLAADLKGTECIALISELGAGKTNFVQGLMAGLNPPTQVTSPTFTLINEYKGQVPVYHFDLYRLQSFDELLNIGFNDYLLKKGIILIEWADMFTQVLNECDLFITIKILSENERQIIIQNHYPGP
jgi:tRNA threonylcarbamoyladenosine biosynthesis protein TsaE